jgi:uncharacterized membrane protein YphA (DoxX/SURF4 family)
MRNQFDAKLEQAWWILRVSFGAVAFLAGLDKYFNLLTNWPAYINPLALKMLPVSGPTLMHMVGVIEMLVGLAILTKWTRVGAYVCSAWLVLIALNLVSAGMFLDVAVRDLEMALAAFVLARMTEVRGDLLLNNFREQGSTRAVLREEQRHALAQPR